MAGRAVVTTFVFGVALLIGAAARAEVDRDAESFIEGLANDTVKVLVDKAMTTTDREQALSRLFDQGFDLKTMSRFVLGRYWRGASKPQREEFLNAFREFAIKANSRRLSAFSGERLEVTGSRVENKRLSIVLSAIIRPQGPPTRVTWRVRRKSEKLRIVDVVVEGVSMLITHRDEFASVIHKGGGSIDNLIAVLRDKSASLN